MTFEEDMREALDIFDAVSNEHFNKIWNAAQESYKKEVREAIENTFDDYLDGHYWSAEHGSVQAPKDIKEYDELKESLFKKLGL